MAYPFVARLYQKLSRLSEPPNKVVKMCQVRQQDVAGSRAGRRHPEEHVEFGVSGFDEWMWARQIDRLPSQHANGLCVLRGQCVVRQVLVKIERCHVRQPTRRVEIAHDREWGKLVRALDDGRAKTKPVLHRHPETFHEAARVKAESLLARDQWIAVMGILHLQPFRVL